MKQKDLRNMFSPKKPSLTNTDVQSIDLVAAEKGEDFTGDLIFYILKCIFYIFSPVFFKILA